MSLSRKSYLVVLLRILFGIFILFFVYRIVSFERKLRRYEYAFLQLEHPEGTRQVDSFGLELNYYPATYVDDSIQFQFTFLAGELRSYSGDWNHLKMFYADKRLEVGGANPWFVGVLPVEIDMNGEKDQLNIPAEFSYDPFQADILTELQQYYRSKEIPQIPAGRKLYLVYITPDL